MRVMTAEGNTDVVGEWWPVERLGDAGLPTVFRKAAALAA
jgi:A/G-specific adenine glycosylase